MMSIACILALYLVGSVVASNVRIVRKGPVPTVGGTCKNEGDFQNGNHCVKMVGNSLAEFTKVADISSYDDSWATHKHEEWCVCLHDYLHVWSGTGGDTSSCSQAALGTPKK
jgi:hypothetical protein